MFQRGLHKGLYRGVLYMFLLGILGVQTIAHMFSSAEAARCNPRVKVTQALLQ